MGQRSVQRVAESWQSSKPRRGCHHVTAASGPSNNPAIFNHRIEPMTIAQRSPLRIGILGCASIARQFARDVRPSSLVRIDAVASRDAAKAQAFAAEFGVPRVNASYD